MQRPEQQVPQALASPQKCPKGAKCSCDKPMKSIGPVEMFMTKLAGAVLIVASGMTLTHTLKNGENGIGKLGTILASVIVLLIGIGFIQAEAMTKLSGKLLKDVFPEMPQYGPEGNNQLYGQNMIMDPKAKDPQKMHTMFPNENTILNPQAYDLPMANIPEVVKKPAALQEEGGIMQSLGFQ